MKIMLLRKWWFSVGATLGMLVLLWALGTALAQGPAQEQEVGPLGDISAAASVDSRFTYQGVLEEDGQPVTGQRDMEYKFYTNSSCSGLYVYSDVLNNVPVADGLFSVEVYGNPGTFSGSGVWVAIEVEGTRIGCQEILPTPYALSLRPGASVWAWDVASPSAVLNVRQGNLGSNAFGLYAYGPDTAIYGDGRETGVIGHSYGHAGGRAGVYGDSIMGSGVRGWSSNAAGVRAESRWNSVIEGWDTDPSYKRVFRVDNDGEVYADGGFHCGKISGCWSTNDPADFAEVLPAANNPEPGEVLVIGPDGQLTRSTEPYQTSVIGVYSTRPMYIGGGENMDREGYAPLAIVGIVPVKASAENGPIRPADLLVASSTPGHAMRADPNPPVGTIIGKALEGLDEGSSVIQIVVTLQ